MNPPTDVSEHEEQEEMLRLLNKCIIRIYNYVYTIKIYIDRQASMRDPRICKEERSSYLPEPFATYMASLEHIRPPGSEHNPFDSFAMEDGSSKPPPENDPYVFAMLSGLRSMSAETEEVMNTLVNNGGGIGGTSSAARERRESTKHLHVWNDRQVVDEASKFAIRKGRELHGPQSHSVSPFDRFDLVDLVRKFAPYSAKCNLPRFAAVILRTFRPSASCSIFANKKAVNTGARSDGVGQYVVMKTLLYLREKGYKRACPLVNTFNAENVVATFILPFEVDLNLLCERFPDMVSYNPETFPGVRVRAPQIAPAAQLVFATGSVVTMGGRSPSDHIRALSSTFPMYFSVRVIPRASEKEKRGVDSDLIEKEDKQESKRRKVKTSKSVL